MISTSYATAEVSGRVLGAATRCRTFVLGPGSVFIFLAVSLVRLYEESERAWLVGLMADGRRDPHRPKHGWSYRVFGIGGAFR